MPPVVEYIGAMEGVVIGKDLRIRSLVERPQRATFQIDLKNNRGCFHSGRPTRIGKDSFCKENKQNIVNDLLALVALLTAFQREQPTLAWVSCVYSKSALLARANSTNFSILLITGPLLFRGLSEEQRFSTVPQFRSICYSSQKRTRHPPLLRRYIPPI